MPDRTSNHVVYLMKLLTAGILLAIAVLASSALLVLGDGESGPKVGKSPIATAAEVSGTRARTAPGPASTRREWWSRRTLRVLRTARS